MFVQKSKLKGGGVYFKEKNILIGWVFFVFGVLTIISGGRALFTENGIATRGNIVPLVLWFNFVAGFFYVIASFSIFRKKTCVKRLSIVLGLSNLLVLTYLLTHIYSGKLYEFKTLIAMLFRTSFWISFSFYFYKSNLFKKIECNC